MSGQQRGRPESQKADFEVIFEESGVRGGGDFSLKRWPKLYVLLERRRWEEDGGSYVVSKELNEQQRSNRVRREVIKRSLHSGGSERRARTRTAKEGEILGQGCTVETKASSMLIQIFCKTNTFLSHKTPSSAHFVENSSFCVSVG